jgi:photosystem II stability/assembly factor-like uncharacterized protein
MKQIPLLIAVLICGSALRAQYWMPVLSGTTKHLASISFGSPQVGYIAGADSLLLRTVNGGITWSPVSYSGLSFPPGSPDIIHVNFISAGAGFAIVSSLVNPVYRGALYKTTDSGRSWSPVTTGNIAAARTFFFDAGNGYEIGSAFFAGKTVIRQSNGTWAPEKTFSYLPEEFLYGIDFRNISTGIVGGAGGYAHRTFDGGLTWDTVKTAVDSTINDLRFLSDRTIIGGSDENGGAIIISHDTGRTWHQDMNTLTFSYPDIKGIAVSRRDSFIAVGHASFGRTGLILWYDGLAVANNYPTAQRLNAVAMRDDSVAYIVGDSGAILTNRMALLGIPPDAGQAVPFTLYPNPASGRCNTAAPYLHTLRLYDAAGRLVRTFPREAFLHTIQLGDLCPGAYLLEVSSKGHAPTFHKLLVE